MSRRLLFLFVMPVVWLGLHGTSAAQTGAPTVIFEENCYINPFPPPEGQVYGFEFLVLNAPLDAPVEWRIDFVLIESGEFDGSISGTDWPGFPVAIGSFEPTRYDLTITSPALGGTVTRTLTVTCEPTRVEQCKKGGWRTFAEFKNQGQCVAFVRRGPK